MTGGLISRLPFNPLIWDGNIGKHYATYRGLEFAAARLSINV